MQYFQLRIDVFAILNAYSCRVTQWPFWFGMILPFLVVYIFNWIMFVLIMISLCCRSQGVIVKDTHAKIKAYKAKFKIAAILAVMFGLGWTLGLAATSVPVKEFSLTFQILFSIFVGAQGVLIFLLHGVRNQDIRKLWKKWFKTLGSKSHLSTIISSFLTSEVGRAGGDSSDLSILPFKKDASAPANIYFQKPAVAESNLYVSVTLKGSPEEKDKQEEEKEPSQKEEMESSHKEEESLQKKEIQEEGKECSQKDEKESSHIEEKKKLPEEESADKGESHEEKSQKEIQFITVDKVDDGSK